MTGSSDAPGWRRDARPGPTSWVTGRRRLPTTASRPARSNGPRFPVGTATATPTRYPCSCLAASSLVGARGLVVHSLNDDLVAYCQKLGFLPLAGGHALLLLVEAIADSVGG